MVVECPSRSEPSMEPATAPRAGGKPKNSIQTPQIFTPMEGLKIEAFQPDF